MSRAGVNMVKAKCHTTALQLSWLTIIKSNAWQICLLINCDPIPTLPIAEAVFNLYISNKSMHRDTSMLIKTIRTFAGGKRKIRHRPCAYNSVSSST